ncbi:urea ABC transporter ATP-binding protein UrtD [Domibacillus enclensis]|uniref:ABC transporter ATP-binding protein n=1 Tax=Domibacillus enclensis TaxID=1017273 RepID=A0A1N6ZBR7_9BACI|nr:urea ABC transporter ATP-binding protein UrtD [Domibacillus enclensis]OXS76656.1 ABC transporter ATP-binding protein [Domibacillus enclensis]SIR24265.1 urea ABC transporter ATP-binding protein [Domibacillus enclensis]
MPPILSCRDVRVSFNGFQALQGVDLDVSPQEVRFLIGPNGAGKTTLLDVICGKTKASSGDVLYREVENIRKLQEHEIVRRGITRKFQAPSIFSNLTVWENLELSIKQDRSIWAVMRTKMTGEEKEKIDAMLDRIGLKEQRHQMAGMLAHGQKQWLEIGMQLMQEPEILLLDEPIAGMSGTERHKTGELIHEISAACSVLIVEHDMEFVRNFSKQVTVMHEGKVLCEGTMSDIQQNEQVAEVYLGRRESAC